MIITEKGLIKINSYNEIVNLDEYQKFNCVLFTKSFFLENITKISSQKKNGLLLNSDDKIEDISQHIIIFSLINVRFLNFKDGRPCGEGTMKYLYSIPGMAGAEYEEA